jgi:hypothetical protein
LAVHDVRSNIPQTLTINGSFSANSGSTLTLYQSGNNCSKATSFAANLNSAATLSVIPDGANPPANGFVFSGIIGGSINGANPFNRPIFAIGNQNYHLYLNPSSIDLTPNPQAKNDTCVVPGNQSTALDITSNDTVYEGSATIIQVNNQPILSGVPVPLNSGGSLTLTNNVLWYSPPDNNGIADNFTYTINDNPNDPGDNGTSTATVIIGINRAPVLAPISDQIVYSGASDYVSLSATDPNLGAPAFPNEALTYSIASQPDWANATIATISANPSKGLLTITPSGSLESGLMTIAITDAGGLTDTQTFTVTVDDPNQDDSVTTGYNQTVTTSSSGPNYGTLQNVTDPNGPLTITTINTNSYTPGTALTLTSGGQLTVNADGNFTYTPPTNFIGTDSFTFSATDSIGATVSGTAYIVVAPPPITQPDTYTVPFGQTLTTSGNGVLANDLGANASTLTVTAINGTPLTPGANIPLPSGASLTMGADGDFSYIQTVASNSLTDSFQYTATDQYGGSSTGTATITLTPVAPTVNVTDVGGPYTGATYPATPTVAGIDNSPGIALQGVSPTLQYFDANNNLLSGPPTQGGSYSVVATFAGSTDYTPASNTASFTITPVNTTISLASSAPTSQFMQMITLTATVAPADSGVTGTPTGQVTFYDNGVPLGIANVINGVAAFPIDDLSAGTTHNLTAIYGSDNSFNGSSSSTVVQQVNYNTVTANVTSDANPGSYGQPVTLTVTIAPSAGSLSGTPTGRVEFWIGNNPYLGYEDLVNGVATFVLTGLQPGDYSITIDYDGDSTYLGASFQFNETIDG